MSYDLYQSIRAALASSPSADPHVVAASVLAEVPAREVRAVLGLLLPSAVREVIRADRNHAAPAAPVGRRTNGKRSLGAMTSDPWRMREYVPGAGWKFRGELTAEDCDAIADGYESRASENRAKAKEYRRFAETLRERGGCLRDLGDAAVAA
jgi:hypothetical protein